MSRPTNSLSVRRRDDEVHHLAQPLLNDRMPIGQTLETTKSETSRTYSHQHGLLKWRKCSLGRGRVCELKRCNLIGPIPV